MQRTVKQFYSRVFLLAFLIATSMQLNAQPVTHPYKDMESALMKNVNDYRKSIGKAPLKLNIYVSNIADRHSRDMATKKVDYSNDGFKERTDKIYETLKPVYSFAENVAAVKDTTIDVIGNWLASPKHKKNLEGDYNYSGIGIERGHDSFYITQIFILKGN